MVDSEFEVTAALRQLDWAKSRIKMRTPNQSGIRLFTRKGWQRAIHQHAEGQEDIAYFRRRLRDAEEKVRQRRKLKQILGA
jgi:5-bromo-4-chloroindolyl phosphate hydrolysis protein